MVSAGCCSASSSTCDSPSSAACAAAESPEGPDPTMAILNMWPTSSLQSDAAAEIPQRRLELRRAVAFVVGDRRLQLRESAVHVARGLERAALIHEVRDAADRHRRLLRTRIVAELPVQTIVDEPR